MDHLVAETEQDMHDYYEGRGVPPWFVWHYCGP